MAKLFVKKFLHCYLRLSQKIPEQMTMVATQNIKFGGNMKRNKTALRQNAAFAKSRLITGFWSERHAKQNLVNINNQSSEEEQIFRRVAGCLREGTSPLANVLDHDYMATMDDASRQRYVLNMSHLVQKSIERYNQVC